MSDKEDALNHTIKCMQFELDAIHNSIDQLKSIISGMASDIQSLGTVDSNIVSLALEQV